jgi:hypothetical protein
MDDDDEHDDAKLLQQGWAKQTKPGEVKACG